MEYETLKSKWWYRLLKVIYIIVYIFVSLCVVWIAWDSRPQTYTLPNLMTYEPELYSRGNWGNVIQVLAIGLPIIYIIFEIIKGIFFYISTGKWLAFKFRLKK